MKITLGKLGRDAVEKICSLKSKLHRERLNKLTKLNVKENSVREEKRSKKQVIGKEGG